MAKQDNRQRYTQQRVLALAIGLGVVVAAGLASYLLTSTKAKSKLKKTYTKNSIAIVLSSSVISANLPLAEILSNTSNVVVLLPPSLKRQDLNDFDISLDDSYKIIECDTEIGIFHVLKHLKYQFNFVCLDDLTLPSEKIERLQLKQFLPNIVYLEQNNEMIYEEFLKYLFY